MIFKFLWRYGLILIPIITIITLILITYKTRTKIDKYDIDEYMLKKISDINMW